MKVIFLKEALQDFLSLEKALQDQFSSHVDKLTAMPPRRHMKFGIPYHVESITKQARLVYCERNEALFVVRCFSSHKEYERWYRSFR